MIEILSKKEKLIEGLRRFLPDGFEHYVADLLIKHPIKFKIVPPRKTKLGDFRAGFGIEKPIITVNGDLNPYAFLITTLHEFAHLYTFLEHGFKVQPHGNEWKNNYRKLILPIIESKKLPSDIEKVLLNSLVVVKASSCSDIHLTRILKKYDQSKDTHTLLENLPKNTIFVLNGRSFEKGELRRKKFLCRDLISNKKYLVHALAEVEIVNLDNSSNGE